MCAALGGPRKGDARHPSSAAGALPPPTSPPPPQQGMRRVPQGPRYPGAPQQAQGDLTQPSPRDLPACLARLGRSPEARRPVWTVRGEGGGLPPAEHVIITDICLNHKPELTLGAVSGHDLRQLSAADLHKQAAGRLLGLRREVHGASQPAEGGCCLLGAARAALDRLLTFVSRASCRRGVLTEEEQQQQQVVSSTTLRQPPEVVVTPERRRAGGESPSKEEEEEERPPPLPLLQKQRVRLASTSADPICQSPEEGTSALLQPPADGGLRVARSLLDIQREKERAELHPARYLDDLRVLYNIHRRELVSQLVYREAGQIFQRGGGSREPRQLRRVIGSPAADAIKDQSHTHESKQRLVRKIASLRPVVSPRVGVPEPCWGDSEFVQACLKAHNLYRARHSAPPLTLSSQLCRLAQAWVNQLAHTGTLRHKGEPGLGENLFCRNTALILRGRASVMPDITGEEVAAYWYSSVRQYKFNRPPNVLQASQGPFTQMVWERSREFGVGKARSRSGKIIVVAHYTPAGNIENDFKENVHPLNTRALAAEILGQIPGLTTLEQVDGRTVERVMGVLAAQPPRLTGRNATKVIAAHLLGHSASLVTTPEEEIRVVINTYPSPRRGGHKRTSFEVGPNGPFNALSTIPEASCCPPRFRLRTRASVSPADIQSSIMHEPSESHRPDDDVMGPSRRWLEPQSSRMGDPGNNSQTEVIELKRGDLGTPSSDIEDISSLSLSVSPNNSSRPKKPRYKKEGDWNHGTDCDSSDIEAIRRESFDSVDSQSHPEPKTPSRLKEDAEREEAESNHGDVRAGTDKHSLGLRLPFDIPDAEHGRMNYYALSPMRY